MYVGYRIFELTYRDTQILDAISHCSFLLLLEPLLVVLIP